MRCPKCYYETPAEAYSCPSCNLPTPKGRMATKTGSIQNVGSVKKDSSVKKRKIDYGALLPAMPGTRTIFWVVLLGVLGVSGFLAYRYIYSDSTSIAPQPALQAMQQLRMLPSQEEGKNIEDCLNAKIKKSKEAGQLTSYQGWTIKPYENNSYLISFSFDEKESKHSAEWVVNPQTNTFIPISELANAIHKQEN